MKKTEFESLIKNKDVNEEETINHIVKSINDEINGIIADKESKLTEKSKQWTDESKILKLKIEEEAKLKSEALKQIEELQAIKASKEQNEAKLNQKLYILKNINSDLDDESIEDLVSLASKKTNDKKSLEEAMKETAEKYNFIKVAKKIQVSTPSGKAIPQDTTEEDNRKLNRQFVEEAVSFRRKR